MAHDQHGAAASHATAGRSADGARESRWERFKRSSWVLVTLVPLGFGSWGAFLYAGSQAQVPRWRTWGVIYLALMAGGWALALVGGEGSTVAGIGFLLVVVVWIGSVAHALVIRGRYLELTFEARHPRVRRGQVLRISRARHKALIRHPDLEGHEVRVYDGAGGTLLWAVGFGIATWFLVVALATDASTRASVWAWLGLAFCGACAYAFLESLVSPLPTLVVGPRGIGRTGQDIPWHDVRRVGRYEQSVRGSTIQWLTVFTGRRVEHALPPPGRAGPLVRALRSLARGIARLDREMAGGADVQINIDDLVLTPEETLQLVRRFYDGPVDDE